jgi:GPH family glycoside/pentoside/hexuronide:cation symporter
MRQRLSFWQKFFYGFGDTSNTVSYTITSLLFLFFLTDVAHLNPALAGVVLLAGKFWDAVTDPLTGYISDHLRTPLGRRRPFFIAAALPFALTFVLMWIVPQQLSQGGLFVYYVFAYSLHITFFTAYAVPYQALAAELTGDYDERTALNSFRMFFSIVLGLVAAVLPRAIVERFVSAPRGYVAMAWAAAAIIVVPPLVVFVATREPPLAAVGRRARDSFMAEVRQVLANKPYRAALLMYLFTWMGVDVVSAVFLYYATYVVHMETQSSLLFAILFITAVLFLPFWVWASGRLGKKTAYIAGTAFVVCVLAVIAAVPVPSPWVVYTLLFLAGIGISSSHVLPSAIIPDCIELDELESGTRREGMYYGFSTFLQKLASAGAIAVVGVILSLGGYVAGAVQSPRSVLTIRLLVGGFSGFIFLGGIVSMLFYPITRERYQDIQRQLAERKAAASPETGV